jgi:hypothetical protein
MGYNGFKMRTKRLKSALYTGYSRHLQVYLLVMPFLQNNQFLILIWRVWFVFGNANRWPWAESAEIKQIESVGLMDNENGI